MNVTSAKQEAIDAIERLADDVPLDEIVYQLHVLSKIQQGVRDANDGRTLSAEELSRDVGTW